MFRFGSLFTVLWSGFGPAEAGHFVLRQAGPPTGGPNPEQRWAATLADPQAVIAPDEMPALVAPDLADADPLIRRVALESIAARLGLVRFQAGPDASLASATRAALREVRPQIVSLLADPDERVRQAAVRTLGALGLGGTGRAPVLDRATQQTLLDAFPVEASAPVRAEMLEVATFTAPADAALHRQLLTLGLDAPDPAVLAAAVRGVGERRVAGPTLTRVVALLDHADRDVRVAAAGALRTYGEAARPHLSAVRLAQARAADPSTRTALDAVVQSLDRAPAPGASPETPRWIRAVPR